MINNVGMDIIIIIQDLNDDVIFKVLVGLHVLCEIISWNQASDKFLADLT